MPLENANTEISDGEDFIGFCGEFNTIGWILVPTIISAIQIARTDIRLV